MSWEPTPLSQHPANDLTVQSIIAAFESLPFAFQCVTMDVLTKIHENRQKMLAQQNALPEKTIPLHDPKEAQKMAAAEQAKNNPPRCALCGMPKDQHPWAASYDSKITKCEKFVAKQPTRLATVEEMLKPHPHIGKTKPAWERHEDEK